MFDREVDQSWTKEELQKQHGWNSFDYAGSTISRIEAKLGRIRVFGHYGYDEIINKLGLLESNETLVAEKGIRNYEIKVVKEIKSYPDFYLTVFMNNKKSFFPQCSIEIYPKNDISLETHKVFLVWINEKLPNSIVSKVEYVVDQFCLDHLGAIALFWLDIRCLHLSYRRKGRILGEYRPQEERSRSLAYQIGRYHRVTERGPDLKKQGQDWFLKDIDRVRLDHNVNRAKLKKYGINTLNDLIENPRFSILNLHRWRFMQFLKSRKLPKFWQPFSTKDQGGQSGLCKLESIRPKRKEENVSDYISSYKELVRIEFRINRAMKSFDLEWYNIPRESLFISDNGENA